MEGDGNKRLVLEDGRPICRVCDRVLPDQHELESHMLTCIQPHDGINFAHMWKPGLVENKCNGVATPYEGEKQVVLSQVLAACESSQPIEQGAVNMCDICSRTFPTARGLKQHKRSCPNKNISKNDTASAAKPAATNISGTPASGGNPG